VEGRSHPREVPVQRMWFGSRKHTVAHYIGAHPRVACPDTGWSLQVFRADLRTPPTDSARHRHTRYCRIPNHPPATTPSSTSKKITPPPFPYILPSAPPQHDPAVDHMRLQIFLLFGMTSPLQDQSLHSRSHNDVGCRIRAR
jgi:hypothetical protein